MNTIRTILILVVAAFSSQQSSAQKVYVHCGSLFDSAAKIWNNEQTVIIENDKIIAIKSGFVKAAKKDMVIDLTKAYVMPGFIDMHVHIEGESSPSRQLDRFVLNPEDVALRATIYARRTLQAGFTTVRDLGGSGANIALKKAIERGYVEGPRIFTTGRGISSTGGHLDPTSGYSAALMGNPGPALGVVNSPDEARKAVRQRYKNGANVIKIAATGGVTSTTKNGKNAQFTEEEIRAIVETAADYGMLTAAHAHGDEGMQRAVKAGIKTIEHGTLMSENTMDLMIEKNTYLVPTITAGKQVSINAGIPGYYPPMVAAKAKEIGGEKVQATFEKAYKRGVPIAFGSDAGVFKHGENAREFFYMHEAGMPVNEALHIATLVNASLLGVDDTLGRLEAGYSADLVAVSKNPEKEVKILQSPIFVMKDGNIVDLD